MTDFNFFNVLEPATQDVVGTPDWLWSRIHGAVFATFTYGPIADIHFEQFSQERL